MSKQSVDFKKCIRWYVVANRSGAVFYQTTRKASFQFVERLKNPRGKLTEGELDSDAPGTGFSSAGEGTIHHGLDRTFKHHEGDARDFAKRIALTLDKALKEERFNELVLVCEPHFLGLLRATLSIGVREMIRHEVNREYAQGSDEQVHSLILQAIEAHHA